MKNYAICLVLLCTFGITTVFSQVSFGVKGGLTFANAQISGSGIELDTDMKTTFHIGPIVEVAVTEAVGVNAALLYAGRGYNYSFDVFGTTVETKNSLWYLQVPVNLVYNADLFYFSAGPYVGFGVGGKSTSDDEEDVDVEFGNTEDDDVAPSDFGLNVELGVNLNAARIGVGYGLGLSNNAPGDIKDSDDSFEFKNNAINVSATFFFGG